MDTGINEMTNISEKYRLVWLQERTKLNNMLVDCMRDHSTPPPNYWVPEHQARKKYEMALIVEEEILKVVRKRG